MRIGFDAKRAYQNFTGLGNYSRDLIENLIELYPSNEYRLFAPKENKNQIKLSILAQKCFDYFSRNSLK